MKARESRWWEHLLRAVSCSMVFAFLPPKTPTWRWFVITVGVIVWGWLMEREGERGMMKRYEKTRDYLMREGYIDG